MGAFDWLFGSNDKMKKVDLKTKEQNQLHNTILAQLQQSSGQGGGYNNANNYYNNLLQPGGDAFQNFADPYMQQFREQIEPRIAERYAGAGALSSSGFGQAIGGANAGLQSQLAQLFSSLQQNAAGQQYNQYNQMGQSALNYEPFGYEKQEGSSGFLGPLATGLGTAIAGPIGGLAAGGISSLFTKGSGGGGGYSGLAGNSSRLASYLPMMGGR